MSESIQGSIYTVSRASHVIHTDFIILPWVPLSVGMPLTTAEIMHIALPCGVFVKTLFFLSYLLCCARADSKVYDAF